MKPIEVLDSPKELEFVLKSLIESKGDFVVRLKPEIDWLITRMGMSEQAARGVLGLR